MSFYDNAGWFGQATQGITNNITGDIYVTFILYLILFVFLGLAIWKLPAEWLFLLCFSVVVVFMAYMSEWVFIGGVLLFFLSIMLIRNWITD